jgi:hypothetical protein
MPQIKLSGVEFFSTVKVDFFYHSDGQRDFFPKKFDSSTGKMLFIHSKNSPEQDQTYKKSALESSTVSLCHFFFCQDHLVIGIAS